ncbi:MAG: class I SAM-dependent methyltransferase [Calditrichaceae bacterium]
MQSKNSIRQDIDSWLMNKLPIVGNWESYFSDHDEGLGTTYERFILHKYFGKIKKQFDIKSILEVPSFGMTGVSGINSLWWANQGVETTVVDVNADRLNQIKKVWSDIPLKADLQLTDSLSSLSFGDKSIDCSWNFASLWFVDDLDKFLTELTRITKKVIFISVPNRSGLGFLLRFGFRLKNKENFFLKHILPARIIKILKLKDWKLREEGYFDIPPWPDIPMKKEELFRKLGLGFIFNNKKSKNERSEELCILNYFNGTQPEMENNILKYSILEKSPFPIKNLWGHHRYFIFVPE